jgi:hypothetical protein
VRSLYDSVALWYTLQGVRRRRGLIARVVQGYVETIPLFKINHILVMALLHWKGASHEYPTCEPVKPAEVLG